MSDKDSEKITTFHRAAFIGNATLLTSFLDEGVDVNAAIDRVTPLHLAAGQGTYVPYLYLKLCFIARSNLKKKFV